MWAQNDGIGGALAGGRGAVTLPALLPRERGPVPPVILRMHRGHAFEGSCRPFSPRFFMRTPSKQTQNDGIEGALAGGRGAAPAVFLSPHPSPLTPHGSLRLTPHGFTVTLVRGLETGA